jgi:hypothetical protein
MSEMRESLPDVRDEDNPVVWCKRCQKYHKQYTLTRHDFDQTVERMADLLAQSLDARIEDELFRETT